MTSPTEAQRRFRDHPSLALLVTAPAGCGKTEALAMRVGALLESGRVVAPRRVLLTTFTNKARENLRQRLHHHLTQRAQWDRVTVANFHGLAVRLIRAHGDVIGIDPDMDMPERDWVDDRCVELGIGYAGRDAVAALFKAVKQQTLTDGAVMAALEASANGVAVRIESERVSAGRASYDDLLRYAELILEVDAVAELYQQHFAAVLVDEYQDLTPQQLRVLERIGPGRTTFAGDLAQGIYTFAGARPAELGVTIRTLCDDVVVLDESHRSSPAVLSMVNALGPHTGGIALRCATPSEWPGGGVAARVVFPHADDEASRIVRLSRAILHRAPQHRVAVMSRVRSRLRFVDAEASRSDLAVHRWEDGILDAATATIVRTVLSRLDAADLTRSPDPMELLRDVAGFDRLDDPDTRAATVDAFDWVLERLADGLGVDGVADRIRVGDQRTLLDVPGLHLLSAHAGKGQQFEWVVVAGLEDGNIPFFKAASDAELLEEARVLGVMVSRARHGVLLTAADTVPTLRDEDKRRTRSRFWTSFDAAGPLDLPGLLDWLRAAPWPDLATR